MKHSLSKYSWRLRAPKGLDNTLIKELNQMGILTVEDNIKPIRGSISTSFDPDQNLK